MHEQENEKVWDSWADVMGQLLVGGLWEVDQALSMSKVKQKISGCFKTEPKADIFFTIRSYLATMTKRKANLFDCLISVFKRQPVQPRFAD